MGRGGCLTIWPNVDPTPTDEPYVKIALLTYSTRPRGGVVHTLALAEALARRSHDVTVWSLARCGDVGFFRLIDPAVHVRLVPFPVVDGESVGERILRSISVLGNAFDGGNYDVVHAHDCISANAAGPCVRTVHHLDTFTTPELAACHEHAIVDPIAHVCVSAAVARELADGWGIGATVIANGVDAGRFEVAAGQSSAAVAARQRWRTQLGRYVLTIGGIEPRKGSMELLEAFARLRIRRPELALVIGGGETLFDYREFRGHWQERADELGVEPVVLGAVDDAELPALVAGAAVFAFPSTKEGFGLAPMEALSAGVPVVVNDLPVLREVFGGAAVIAGPLGFADALSAAVDQPDPDRRDAGRRLARAHSWDTSAEQHELFYASLTSAPPPGS